MQIHVAIRQWWLQPDRTLAIDVRTDQKVLRFSALWIRCMTQICPRVPRHVAVHREEKTAHGCIDGDNLILSGAACINICICGLGLDSLLLDWIIKCALILKDYSASWCQKEARFMSTRRISEHCCCCQVACSRDCFQGQACMPSLSNHRRFQSRKFTTFRPQHLQPQSLIEFYCAANPTKESQDQPGQQVSQAFESQRGTVSMWQTSEMKHKARYKWMAKVLSRHQQQRACSQMQQNGFHPVRAFTHEKISRSQVL